MTDSQQKKIDPTLSKSWENVQLAWSLFQDNRVRTLTYALVSPSLSLFMSSPLSILFPMSFPVSDNWMILQHCGLGLLSSSARSLRISRMSIAQALVNRLPSRQQIQMWLTEIIGLLMNKLAIKQVAA